MKILEFGLNKKGESANHFVFENQNGMEMHVSDFGASLVALLVPDKNGKKRDVVLGYDTPMEYEGPSGTFFGVTVGRHANRIGGASFVLDGKIYSLDKNDGENNLHSGYDFWSFRVWKVKETTENSITFALHSPDGDQGFSGAVDVEVAYTLTEDNRVCIEYRAVPDADTPINLTNHSYFNMDGHDAGNIRKQWMWVDADAFTRTDSKLIPTGEILSVEGTPMDFRVEKEIGRDIEADYEAIQIGNGYDHNWVLNHTGEFRKAASLTSRESGISMSVYTDLPGVQIYSGNFLNDEKGKHGVVYQQNQGICFETQYFPDSVNHGNFPTCICKKGEIFVSRTEFRF